MTGFIIAIAFVLGGSVMCILAIVPWKMAENRLGRTGDRLMIAGWIIFSVGASVSYIASMILISYPWSI